MAKEYHVGIDFGTSQTKICISNIQEQNRNHIFHKFSSRDDKVPFLLPSTIKLNADGFCDYGINEPNLIRYFKMRALFYENSDYAISKKGDVLSNRVNQNTLMQYPEICCILYLSYCIIDLKQSLSVKHIERREVKTEEHTELISQSFFSRLLGRRKETKSIEETISVKREEVYEDHKYMFTIGIPTEYDETETNYKRRSKQYEILYIAVQLAKEFISSNKFKQVKINELLTKIKHYYDTIETETKTQKVAKEFYEKRHGLYIIAETTAGIEPIRNELKIQLSNTARNQHGIELFKREHEGYYMTMDVGAGTTDVSFFRFYLQKKNGNDWEIKFQYYASKSIEAACNSLYLNYLYGKINAWTNLTYNNSHVEAISQFNFDDILPDEWRNKQRTFRSYLFNEIRQPELFGRVAEQHRGTIQQNWHYGFERAKGCKVYGGGCKFNEFSSGVMMLHNGGAHAINVQTETELQRWYSGNEMSITRHFINKDGRPLNDIERREINNSLHLLNVALGLAMLNPRNRPDTWIERRNDELTLRNNNKSGMANYDIFNRDWL